MFSKYNLLKSLSKNHNKINIYKKFTSLTKSTQLTESPELPIWVKFTELQNPEDNFILPKNLYFSEKIKKIEKNEIKPINEVEKVSKILEKKFESIDEVEKALGENCDILISEGLICKILKRFSTDCVISLGFFNWAKTQIEISADLYNLLVDNLGKCKRFDLLWELIEEMNKIDGYVTILTLTRVMRRLAKNRKYNEAIMVFKEIEKFGLEKDIKGLNALLDALVKENSVEHAEKVFSEFKEIIKPDLSSFNVLIHGWCKIRNLEKAKNVVFEMEKNGFCMDVFSYTCFVEMYCREKNFRKVDWVLEEMEMKGCLPNSVTYTIVMHALGKAKELNKMLDVYEKMKQNGCVYDASVYSSLIYNLSKFGRLKDACEVFDEMPKRGVIRDTFAYNTMISSVCEHLQEENALKLLSEMDASECKPDVVTYAPLLKLFCRKQRMKVVSFLLRHMFENDVSLDFGTYTLLVRGLCNGKKLEQACLFFEEMVVKGFVPMDCTVEMLKKGLERQGMKKAKARVEELVLQAKSQKSK